LIGIFAKCAIESGTWSSQSSKFHVIVSYTAFSSTCYLAGKTASCSESIDAYNRFTRAWSAFSSKSYFCRIFASIVGVATV